MGVATTVRDAFCEKAKEDDREMIKRSMPAFEKIYKKYNK